jgi:hypothetical protein
LAKEREAVPERVGNTSSWMRADGEGFIILKSSKFKEKKKKKKKKKNVTVAKLCRLLSHELHFSITFRISTM